MKTNACTVTSRRDTVSQMSFVKLDCGLLTSTLWFDREAREVFITALLLAKPEVFDNEIEAIEVDTLQPSGWTVPAGWYGFAAACGPAIVSLAKIDQSTGMLALRRLCQPDGESRSKEYDGRRMARINGGYIILNYIKYRERDYTSAERSRRYRQRLASRRDTVTPRRDITQAEEEAEAEKKYLPLKSPFKVPSKAMVLEEGQLRGYLPEVCETFWNHYESTGWVDKNEHTIVKWQPKLANWAARARMESAGKGPAIGPATQAILNEKELTRIEERIGQIQSSYDSHQMLDVKDAAELSGLRQRRRELKKALGWQH